MVLIEEYGDNMKKVKRVVKYVEADDEHEDESSPEGSDGSDEGDLHAMGHGEAENSTDDGGGSEDDTSEDEEGNDSKEDESSDEDPLLPVDNDEGGDVAGERCTLDLRNLTAVNSHQVSTQALYNYKKKSNAEDESNYLLTISAKANAMPSVNEDHIFEKAREGCTQLLRGLWSLGTERTDAGPMAVLPEKFEIKTPRELPPPPPKQETKWEKFAKERGIATNKEKRSRKVWDEATQTWMYRHGYQKANDDSKEWPIMEVKGNEDPFADPWERARDAKRSRIDKNLENKMRNMERAGMLPKGTATRTTKDQKKASEAGRAGGKKDAATPVGIPVDMSERKRGKDMTKAALIATQRSTASLGKFDSMREGEPERKKAISGLKKRKFESATDKKVVRSEADRNIKLLDNMMKGGGVEKAKAIRRGDFAKGETAYDNDYSDGLGASSFKKKKGRAGAGKMKKVTKKRVK